MTDTTDSLDKFGANFDAETETMIIEAVNGMDRPSGLPTDAHCEFRLAARGKVGDVTRRMVAAFTVALKDKDVDQSVIEQCSTIVTKHIDAVARSCRNPQPFITIRTVSRGISGEIMSLAGFPLNIIRRDRDAVTRDDR